MFIDVTYFKARDELYYENKVHFIVAEMRDDGYCEIPEARLVDTEDSLFWKDLFDNMKERGLRDIKLTVYNGHKGIQKIVNESFHELSLQMFHMHLIGQVLKKVPKKKQIDVAEKLKKN